MEDFHPLFALRRRACPANGPLACGTHRGDSVQPGAVCRSPRHRRGSRSPSGVGTGRPGYASPRPPADPGINHPGQQVHGGGSVRVPVPSATQAVKPVPVPTVPGDAPARRVGACLTGVRASTVSRREVPPGSETPGARAALNAPGARRSATACGGTAAQRLPDHRLGGGLAAKSLHPQLPSSQVVAPDERQRLVLRRGVEPWPLRTCHVPPALPAAVQGVQQLLVLVAAAAVKPGREHGDDLRHALNRFFLEGGAFRHIDDDRLGPEVFAQGDDQPRAKRKRLSLWVIAGRPTSPERMRRMRAMSPFLRWFRPEPGSSRSRRSTRSAQPAGSDRPSDHGKTRWRAPARSRRRFACGQSAKLGEIVSPTDRRGPLYRDVPGLLPPAQGLRTHALLFRGLSNADLPRAPRTLSAWMPVR